MIQKFISTAKSNKLNRLMSRYPLYRQLDSRDCGPACLRMVCRYFGRSFSQSFLRKLCFTHNAGTSMLGISDAAMLLGFNTKGVKTTVDCLRRLKGPCILQWNKEHFVVLYQLNDKFAFIGDPAIGILRYNLVDFIHCWCLDENSRKGLALILEPTDSFASFKAPEETPYFSFGKLFSYLTPHKQLLCQLILTLLLGSTINLLFPFFTQAIVDIGIADQILDFILVILLAQLSLIIGQAANDYLSSWFLLHISSRVSIVIVDDFIAKLMKLPIGFFNRKHVGDLLQRIDDFERIETFLTTVCISMLLTVIGFVVYGTVLGSYGGWLLIIYFIGSVLYVTWVSLLLKRRKRIDYMRFQQSSRNKSSMLQLINGMEEIKLNNCEKSKRQEWQDIQMELYGINVKGLALEQIQSSGGVFINSVKNVCISYFAAKGVIGGDMTVGVMMAVQYIIGQMDGPLGQVVGFLRSLQDTKISMERANEVGLEGDEDLEFTGKSDVVTDLDMLINEISYQYNGPRSPFALKNVSMRIPNGKVTAIVGASGSGKTTLIRLLLGILTPTEGSIMLGDKRLQDFDLRQWRKNVGVVMQDGFLFTDTIAKNIALSEDDGAVDMERVRCAAEKACIDSFIERLPLKYETVIGADGTGLSMGQRQRILIARAVYKNAPYLFLDEATNSLDATNEKHIMNHLRDFYGGKTVVVVAHRLSTVKDADTILVMEKGGIVESGTHSELVERRGVYYSLVKNQLELGN